MNNQKQQILKICQGSKIASKSIYNASNEVKNNVLKMAVKLLGENKENILKHNKIDVENALKIGLNSAKIDRLHLNETRIDGIIKAVEDLILLPDPVGKILYETSRENGLNIKRVSTPIGVLLAIYESRPNVTSDISALAIKSGNSVILRAGSESHLTSKIIAQIFQEALRHYSIDEKVVNFIENNDRNFLKKLLQQYEFIDVVIPRGGKDLINAISKYTKIPIFKHLDGNCHTYIHQDANLEKAKKILFNAKLRRVGICGATESLLIDKKIAKEFLPKVLNDLFACDCEIRGSRDAVKIDPRIKLAKEKDYYTEYLDKILLVKIVKNIEEAIEHIAKYGSSHTESIITENKYMAQKFQNEVDSAIVMHNASTQFADGNEFGLGGEVGIATGKLHARGPVGLEQLTTFKYKVYADCGLRK
ncbi:MAG: glutamate-5-semialdehyde dehydrogenase [Alphaproteobacteria bacterium]